MTNRYLTAQAIHGALCPGEEEFNEIGDDERTQFLEAAEAAMAVWFGDSARRLRIYREGYDDGYHDGRGAR